jgi:hypothetical protein
MRVSVAVTVATTIYLSIENYMTPCLHLALTRREKRFKLHQYTLDASV